MKFSRFFASALSLMLVSGGSTFLPITSASATTDTILLGDVSDGDGVTAMDALWVQRYLRGEVTATPRQLTAMDVNEDGVIDNTDARTILYKVAMGGFSSVTKELYTVPDNSTMTYYNHNCSSTDTSQFTQYTLQASTSYPVSTRDTNSSKAPINLGDDETDNENIECVELVMVDSNNVEWHGSGIVVDDNVIATAAHCLYSGNAFMKSVTINFYNENCTKLEYSTTAKNIHIPANYASSGSSNYDYGLIYVDDDVSDYVANVGIMTDYFMGTSQILTSSGFTVHSPSSDYKRYYSSGAVNQFNSNYRFESCGYCYGGKSGGMTYFESTATPTSTYTINSKSCVGICTHRVIANNYTRGIRLTTTVLRFFYQNSNLN